jgi:hypothetical protein
MNAADLDFDDYGQSQEMKGTYPATDVKLPGARPTPARDYGFVVRRTRSFADAGRAPVGSDAINDGQNTEWKYWLVGEDGVILTGGLTEGGMLAAVNTRISGGMNTDGRYERYPAEKDGEESEDDYNRRTNYGHF